MSRAVRMPHALCRLLIARLCVLWSSPPVYKPTLLCNPKGVFYLVHFPLPLAPTPFSICHLDSPVSTERCILDLYFPLRYNCQLRLIKHAFRRLSIVLTSANALHCPFPSLNAQGQTKTITSADTLYFHYTNGLAGISHVRQSLAKERKVDIMA